MKKSILKILYIILAFFSRIYIKRHKIFTIGITGSVGKTTCRTIVFQILEKYSEKRIYTSPKNYNSELGLIFSIFKIENYTPGIKNLFLLTLKIFLKALFGKKEYDTIVLEYGIDRPNDMDFLLTVNTPDIAIFTKLDFTHSEFFGKREFVGKEKFKMLHSAKKKAYLNYNDEYCQKEFKNIGVDKEFYWRIGDCSNYKLIQNDKSIISEFQSLGKTVTTNAIGEANMQYINLGLRLLEIVHQKKIEENIYLELSGQKARFSILQGVNNSILVDSTYNAGPASMKKIIDDTLVLQKELYPDYKVGFCLGDMREIGNKSDGLHKEIFQMIKSSDCIIGIGPEIEKSFGEKTEKFISSEDAGKYLKNFLNRTQNKYIILFKGSQNTIFVEEALIQVLKNKKDQKELCRQEKYWLQKKKSFFNNIIKE